jgi:hypothetical protein
MFSLLKSAQLLLFTDLTVELSKHLIVWFLILTFVRAVRWIDQLFRLEGQSPRQSRRNRVRLSQSSRRRRNSNTKTAHKTTGSKRPR